MVSVEVNEAKTRLPELLTLVETQRETVLICRNGEPVAELVRCQQTADPLVQHPKLSHVVFHEDLSLPLDDDEWPGDRG